MYYFKWNLKIWLTNFKAFNHVLLPYKFSTVGLVISRSWTTIPPQDHPERFLQCFVTSRIKHTYIWIASLKKVTPVLINFFPKFYIPDYHDLGQNYSKIIKKNENEISKQRMFHTIHFNPHLCFYLLSAFLIFIYYNFGSDYKDLVTAIV